MSERFEKHNRPFAALIPYQSRSLTHFTNSTYSQLFQISSFPAVSPI